MSTIAAQLVGVEASWRNETPMTYAEVPDRVLALERAEEDRLLRELPKTIRIDLLKAFLDGQEPSTALRDYTLANSRICREAHRLPISWTRTLEYLYAMSATSAIDRFLVHSRAAAQLRARLETVQERLPMWLRLALLQEPREVLRVENIGAGVGRDMLGVLLRNPVLRARVKVHAIDSDATALAIGAAMAEGLGLTPCMTFTQTSLVDVLPAAAGVIVLIGLLARLELRTARRLLRSLQRRLRRGGFVILSTPSPRMVQADPLADFLMRLHGWELFYQSEESACELVRSLDWQVVGRFHDEPERFHTVLVAQIPT